MPDWCQQRVPNSGLEVTSSKNIGLNIGATFFKYIHVQLYRENRKIIGEI